MNKKSGWAGVFFFLAALALFLLLGGGTIGTNLIFLLVGALGPMLTGLAAFLLLGSLFAGLTHFSDRRQQVRQQAGQQAVTAQVPAVKERLRADVEVWDRFWNDIEVSPATLVPSFSSAERRELLLDLPLPSAPNNRPSFGFPSELPRQYQNSWVLCDALGELVCERSKHHKRIWEEQRQAELTLEVNRRKGLLDGGQIIQPPFDAKVRCSNGHRYRFEDLDEDEGGDRCPTCRTSLIEFEDESYRRYQPCIEDHSLCFDKEAESQSYWFLKELPGCPVCHPSWIVPESAADSSCPDCGFVRRPGATFCTKCGGPCEAVRRLERWLGFDYLDAEIFYSSMLKQKR